MSGLRKCKECGTLFHIEDAEPEAMRGDGTFPVHLCPKHRPKSDDDIFVFRDEVGAALYHSVGAHSGPNTDMACPRCMGRGHIPVGPKHKKILDVLISDHRKWFTHDELNERCGPTTFSLISGLVVAGLAECNDDPHRGNKYRVNPYWHQAHKERDNPTKPGSWPEFHGEWPDGVRKTITDFVEKTPMDPIIVTISGAHDTGRTTLAVMFQMFLKENGYEHVTVEDTEPLSTDQKDEFFARFARNRARPIQVQVETT